MSKKVALVTGAGKRIGQAIAIHLAELGYEIVVHYSSSQFGAEATKAMIERLGGQAYLCQADLAESYAPKELIREVTQVFKRLDLLVNCASTYPEPERLQSKHMFVNESEQEWDEAMAVNTKAPFFLIKYAAPLLEKSENGIVINILDRSVGEFSLSRAAHSVSKNALSIVTELGAKSFESKFKVCSLLLGRIIPGEKMSQEQIDKVSWVGIAPVLKQISMIIEQGVSGVCYKVT